MSKKFIGIHFSKQENRASEVFKGIRTMREAGSINVENGAVIVKNYKGNVKLRETGDFTTGKGAGQGAIWGTVIGLLAGGPIAGLLMGTGIGALVGTGVDHDFDPHQLRELAEEMDPGDSAILILVDSAHYDVAATKLSDFGGTMYTSDLSVEAWDQLAKAADHAKVAEAAEAVADREWARAAGDVASTSRR